MKNKKYILGILALILISGCAYWKLKKTIVYFSKYPF